MTDDLFPHSWTQTWPPVETVFANGVGFFIPTHRSTYPMLSRSWEWAEELGADMVVIEDHLLSFDEDDPSPQYECWALLAAMAERTSRIQFSGLVSPVGMRNAAVTAKAAATIDHISGGRFIVGLGGGWMKREFEYAGVGFPPYSDRLREVERTVEVCRSTWTDRLLPPQPSRGTIPIMIGGNGESKTMPAVARIADIWNCFGPLDGFRKRNERLTECCKEIGRDPASILRTVAIHTDELGLADEYREAGADLILVMVTHHTPYNELARIVDLVRAPGPRRLG